MGVIYFCSNVPCLIVMHRTEEFAKVQLPIIFFKAYERAYVERSKKLCQGLTCQNLMHKIFLHNALTLTGICASEAS